MRYLEKGPMQFNYGGKDYAEGYERIFGGNKKCRNGHALEFVPASDSERAHLRMVGMIACVNCDLRSVIARDPDVKLCTTCLMPENFHSEDHKKVVFAHTGEALCQEPKGK